MHPYAGDPTRYPPNVNELDDPDLNPATAAALNVGIQNLADRTAYLAGIVRPISGENWYALGLQGNTPVTRPAWDPVNGMWLFTYLAGGTNGAVQGKYGLPGSTTGVLDTVLGFPVTGAPFVTSVCKDPTDATTFYLAAIGLGGNNDLYVWSLNATTGVYTQVLHATDGVYEDAELWYFKGSLICATVTSTASSIRISRDHGATWTQPYLDTNTSSWVLQDNGTQFMALACTVFGPAAPHVVTSSDGLTFTQRAITGMGSTYVGLGLAWGSDIGGGCWMVLANNGGPRSFWRSYDGINWAQVGATLTATPADDIAAIGPIFVIVSAASVGFTTPATYISYSLDGCATFHRSQAHAAVVSGSLLATNGGQFCLGAGLAALFSQVVGPSGAMST